MRPEIADSAVVVNDGVDESFTIIRSGWELTVNRRGLVWFAIQQITHTRGQNEAQSWSQLGVTLVTGALSGTERAHDDLRM
jgi:hypothetical protein